jgi:hypothetical protein
MGALRSDEQKNQPFFLSERCDFDDSTTIFLASAAKLPPPDTIIGSFPPLSRHPRQAIPLLSPPAAYLNKGLNSTAVADRFNPYWFFFIQVMKLITNGKQFI